VNFFTKILKNSLGYVIWMQDAGCWIGDGRWEMGDRRWGMGDWRLEVKVICFLYFCEREVRV